MKLKKSLLLLALIPSASAQCDTYNSSVNVAKDEFGVFFQDKIACSLNNLMLPGAMGTIVILFFVFVVLVLISSSLGGRH